MPSEGEGQGHVSSKVGGKVRWGILTAGRIAHTFAHDIAFADSAELVAVAARRVKDARAFAQQYQIPHALEGYESLYNHPQVDAIYIASPHSFHLAQGIKALQAGKAVLCEKPITLNAEECQTLLNTAHVEQAYLMEAMWSYFLPAIQTAQNWVNDGKIGKVTQVKCDFGYPIPYSQDRREWDASLGGGCLLEMGIYPVALAQLFAPGEPENLQVLSRLAPNGAESDLTWIATQSDVLVTLGTSYLAKLPNILYVIGSEGWIEVPDAWRAKEAKLYQLEQCIEHFIDDRKGSGFEFQIQGVSEDILAGKLASSVVSHHHSLHFQRYMDKVKASWQIA